MAATCSVLHGLSVLVGTGLRLVPQKCPFVPQYCDYAVAVTPVVDSLLTRDAPALKAEIDIPASPSPTVASSEVPIVAA